MSAAAGARAGAPSAYSDGRINQIIDPLVYLAAAAAATSTVKLGTGICLVPERNPIRLAKEVATLDLVSGGRFIFGIGAGWLQGEAEVLGRGLPPPLGSDTGVCIRDEGVVDRAGFGVSRQVGGLPADNLQPQASTAAPPTGDGRR